MKTREELQALKDEVEVLNKKLEELTEEELKQVTGGEGDGQPYDVVCPDCENTIAVVNRKRTVHIFCPVCREWKMIEVE